ncbi:hypothetical protein GBA52_010594 [Prunus armeniaca]|nr:hypothetical protein GBA52_010594 [Prunus armeniaca]
MPPSPAAQPCAQAAAPLRSNWVLPLLTGHSVRHDYRHRSSSICLVQADHLVARPATSPVLGSATGSLLLPPRPQRSSTFTIDLYPHASPYQNYGNTAISIRIKTILYHLN